MDFSQLLLQNFSQYLRASGASDNTIKNYLCDVQLFFRYLSAHDQHISLNLLPHLLSSSSISTYQNYLHTCLSPKTAKRRLSSFNKFLAFALSAGLFTKLAPESPSPITNSVSPYLLPAMIIPSPSFRFKAYLPALFILLTIIIAIVAGALAAYIL